jgi:hypothetical protein
LYMVFFQAGIQSSSCIWFFYNMAKFTWLNLRNTVCRYNFISPIFYYRTHFINSMSTEMMKLP